MSFLHKFFRKDNEHRLDWALAGLLFAASFAVYLQTMRRSFGWGDASELTIAAYFLGIGHSPGYPTYMLIGYLFSHLPFGTVAFRMNFMSAFFGAVAVGLSYFVFRRITKSRLGGFLGGATFAFTLSFWDLTTEAEVYTLHAAFVAAIVLLILKWRETNRPHIAWIALLCGISMGNHAMTLLLLPGILLFAAVTKGWRVLISKPMMLAALAFLIGFCVYLYLPLRGPADVPPQVNNPHGLKETLTHMSSPGGRQAMFADGPMRILGRIYLYGGRLRREVSWAGVILGLVGLGLLWRKDRKILALLLPIFALNILYAVNFSIFDIYCYFVASYWVWCVFIGAGGAVVALCGARLLEKVRGPQDSLTPQRLYLIVGSLALLLPFWILTEHWKRVDMSADFEPQEFATAVMSHVEKDSVILGDWWNIAPIAYLKYIDGVRPDVHLSSAFSLHDEIAFRKYLKPEFLLNYSAVYATEALTYGISEFRKQYLVVPEGPLSRIYAQPPEPESVLADYSGEPRIFFGDKLALVGWEITPQTFQPPQIVAVTLYWQSLQADQTGQVYDVILTLREGRTNWAWLEKTSPAHGIYPMQAWKKGQILAERHFAFLSSNCEGGEYELAVKVRHVSGDHRLLPAASPTGETIGREASLGIIEIGARRKTEMAAQNSPRAVSTSRF